MVGKCLFNIYWQIISIHISFHGFLKFVFGGTLKNDAQ